MGVKGETVVDASHVNPDSRSVCDTVLQQTLDIPESDSMVQMRTSRVVGVDPLELELAGFARRAVSCLMAPEIGDVVVCAKTAEGYIWVTAILMRQNPSAPFSIAVDCPVEVIAPVLSFSALEFTLAADRLSLHARLLSQTADRVDQMLDYLSTSVQTVYLKAKRSIRRIEELEDVHAGHLKLESHSLVQIHGEVTAISGEELIKMQSKQIHMG